MLKPFLAVSCLCAATGVGAEAIGLSGQQIRDLIADATIEIHTPLGTKLPISYAADGRLSGQARDLASYLGAASDTGRWWVAVDQLCHKWNRWFDSKPQCLWLRKEGRTIHWASQDGNSGTAVVAVPRPVQTAAALPRMRVETNPHVAAPEPTRTTGSPPTQTAGNPEDTPSVPLLSAETQAALPKGSSPRQSIETKQSAGPVYMVAKVQRDDVLNVRSGPSTEFDVVGELRHDSRGISMTGACLAQWCPVQHDSTRGWVNRLYLADVEPVSQLAADDAAQPGHSVLDDSPNAPRTCLTTPARALLERIEEKFGRVKLVSTCRSGAIIAGSGRPSRHASGNAIDFDAGSRKREIVEWLIANHHSGGTMTYTGMDHVHVDIGPHFVSIAGGQHWASWRDNNPGR